MAAMPPSDVLRHVALQVLKREHVGGVATIDTTKLRQYWRPAHLPQRTLLTVGFDPDALARLCQRSRILAHLQMPYHLANEEQGSPIALCTLTTTLQDIWQTQIVRSTL